MPEFRAFPKIPRFEKFLNSPITITEKIDGTNGCVVIQKLLMPVPYAGDTDPTLLDAWKDQDDVWWGMWAQSRKRVLALDDDNYGFCRWVKDNAEALRSLGHGYHYGEWWGKGIQRGYGVDSKFFSLFNVNRPAETLPEIPQLALVPVLDQHHYSPDRIREVAGALQHDGSMVAPGFMEPEGLMIWHAGIRQYFKHPFDPKPKGA